MSAIVDRRNLSLTSAENQAACGVRITFKSRLELHLNRRLFQFFECGGPLQLAHKGHHQQKAPVPGHCLDWRLRTLSAEKVMTPSSILLTRLKSAENRSEFCFATWLSCK